MERVGRYQVLEELGRGAMGVVYKASDPAIGRTVAIKTIRLTEVADPPGLQRVRENLLAEARSAGMLSHPNIVTVYDVLDQGDVAYVVMEYVQGPSLEDAIRKKRLTVASEIIRLFRQIAEALDYAHRRGVVHRDIKPANILIAESGAESQGIVKITDFGVAKIISPEMPHGGLIAGTPNYMSPEQIQGLPVGPKSDQFSMAVIAYEILAGSKPFVGGDFTVLAEAISRTEARRLEQINPTLTDEVDRVVQRALAKDPDRRFDSCTSFAGALSIVLGDCAGWKPPALVLSDDPAGPRIVERATPVPVSQHAPTRPILAREVKVPAANRDAWIAAAGISGAEQLEHRDSRAKKIALLAALCFALCAAVIFIVRMNSNPNVPVQVLDASSGPVVPPPAQDTAQPATDARQLPPPAPAAENPAKPAENPAKPAENPAKPAENPAKPAENPPKPENPAQQTSQAQSKIPVPQHRASVSKLPAAPPPSGSGTADVDLLTQPPGARISFDSGAKSCTAPCTISLESGRHTLVAQLPGYAVARRIFNVPQDSSVFIPLNRGQGQLVIMSTPPGSEVSIDGLAVGVTPITVRLSAGPHELLVTRGSARHAETVQMEPDGFQTRSIRWQ